MSSPFTFNTSLVAENYYNLSLFFVGALLTFLPLLIGFSLKVSSTNLYPDYLSSLSSFGHSAALLAGICANIFILIDYIFDYFLRRIGKSFVKRNTMMSLVYVPLRESIIYLLIPDILILFWLIPSEHYEGMMVFLNARDTMYTYSILTCLANFSNPVWTWKSVLFIGVPFMISNLLVSFQTFLDPVAFVVLLSIFTSLGLLSFAVYVWRWIVHIVNLKVDETSGTDTILCSGYVLFFGVFLFGTWLVSYFPSSVGDPWSYGEVAYLTWYAYLMAGCTLCMTVMSSCCAKLAAADSKVSTIHPLTDVPLNVTRLVFLRIEYSGDEADVHAVLVP